MLQQFDVGLGLVGSFFWHRLQSPLPVSVSLQAWSLIKCPPTFFEYHQVDFSVIFYLRFWSWASTLPWWSNGRMIGFLFSLRSVSFLLTVCSPSISFASHFKFSWQLSTKSSWCFSPSRCCFIFFVRRVWRTYPLCYFSSYVCLSGWRCRKLWWSDLQIMQNIPDLISAGLVYFNFISACFS